MPLNSVQKGLADRIGELLAESPLDDEIKTALLDKMGEIPEHLLFRLKDALEMEQEELESVAFEIKMFLKEQDNEWQNVVEEQKKAAQVITDKWVQKLK